MEKTKPLLESTEPEPGAIAVVRRDFTGIVERLASNPNVDISKLERIIALEERIQQRDAEAAFNAEFALMQNEIPIVIERGRTDVGTYAELEDIIEAVRPVLARHGFALSHQTEWPGEGWIKIVGILKHRDGHSERSEFLSKADTSGSKNAIQALGSTVSYGRRYTLKDLLCIATRREDDDGRSSEAGNGNGKNGGPAGFEDWAIDMEAVADEGLVKLHATWNKSRPEFRRYVFDSKRRWWETLKKKAAKVGNGR